MTFPFDATGLTVELDVDGGGTFSEDVTGYLIGGQDVLSFFRGLPDLGLSSSTQVTLRFNDADGRFSPRNPTGAYFGRIGRNTRVRLSLPKIGGGREDLFAGAAQDWQPAQGAHPEDREVTVTVRDDLGRSYWARLASAYRRGVTAADTPLTGLVAYWPMEEASGATEFSSGLPDGKPLRIVGAPSLAADDESFECSEPLPTFATGASATVTLPSSITSGAVQVRLLLRAPAGGVAAETSLVRLTFASGTIASADLRLRTDGSVRVTVLNRDGAALLSGIVGYALNGQRVRFELSLQQSGGNVSSKTALLEVGETVGLTSADTLTSQTLGKVRTITIGGEGGLDGVTVGHVTAQTAVTSLFGLAAQLNAYRGETGAARISRLCAEEGIPYDVTAGPGDTTAVCGPQRAETLLDSLRDAEAADGGFLFTPASSTGFAYRSQESMSAQAPKVIGSWVGMGISTDPLPAPLDDDSGAANDVTLSLLTGESVRLVQETGPASVLDPPDGIGRYEVSGTANVNSVAALRQRTGWELAVGTVDEQRLSVFAIDFGAPPYDLSDGALDEAGMLAQQGAVRLVGPGDRVQITDMPSWWGSDVADLLVVGIGYEVGPWAHRRLFVTRPYAPYATAVYSTDAGSRYDSAGTVTSEALDATETGVDIVHGRVRWAHGDGDYDVMIGGERMTVTAVTDLTLPAQRLTVVRSVNGVVKTHGTGAAVELAPAYAKRYGL